MVTLHPSESEEYNNYDIITSYDIIIMLFEWFGPSLAAGDDHLYFLASFIIFFNPLLLLSEHLANCIHCFLQLQRRVTVGQRPHHLVAPSAPASNTYFALYSVGSSTCLCLQLKGKCRKRKSLKHALPLGQLRCLVLVGSSP